MSYSNPYWVTVNYPGTNFATGATRPVELFDHRACHVRDIMVRGTTTFTATTTAGRVQIGVTGEPDKYADLDMGTLAGGSVLTATRDQLSALKDYPVIEKDTDILVTFVAPTGGTPAGVGDVTIVFGYF